VKSGSCPPSLQSDWQHPGVSYITLNQPRSFAVSLASLQARARKWASLMGSLCRLSTTRTSEPAEGRLAISCMSRQTSSTRSNKDLGAFHLDDEVKVVCYQKANARPGLGIRACGHYQALSIIALHSECPDFKTFSAAAGLE